MNNWDLYNMASNLVNTAVYNSLTSTETIDDNKVRNELRKTNYDMSNLTSYKNFLQSSCMLDFKTVSVKKKCPDSEFEIPTEDTVSRLMDYKYKKDQLKCMCKHHKLRYSGTNNELLSRVYSFLKLSKTATKIQKVFRGSLLRDCNYLRGPAFLKRSLCNNEQDFLTGDDMEKVDSDQFISYKAKDGFVYGFDMLSLNNLRLHAIESNPNLPINAIRNPYTRQPIPSAVFRKMRMIVRLSRVIYKKKIDIIIPKIELENHLLPLDQRVTKLFDEINSHGHYTCSEWLKDMDIQGLKRFIHELLDIWYYRAGLSGDVRYLVCPVDPFRNHVQITTWMSAQTEKALVLDRVVSILEPLIFSGVSSDMRSLGVIYTLQSLTLVSDEARTAMPWFFESVAH